MINLAPREPCFEIFFKALSLLGRTTNIEDLRDLKVATTPNVTAELFSLEDGQMMSFNGEAIPDEILDVEVPERL